jgi:hypothetical protein
MAAREQVSAVIKQPSKQSTEVLDKAENKNPYTQSKLSNGTNLQLFVFKSGIAEWTAYITDCTASPSS